MSDSPSVHGIAVLPIAPQNASPVPWLTSLYHKANRGDYGDARFPGNCSGELIKDLLRYFQPSLVFDPMTGSGTCKDVCTELGVACCSDDIHQGFDACDPKTFPNAIRFDFIWAHPPYWRQKIYTGDPRDLSNARTLEDFLKRYERFIRNCAGILAPGGKLAILMGDYSDRDEGFVPLTYHTKRLCFAAGLRQCCTDIIRFSHGASSARKVYRSSFIPGLHDVCAVFEKPGRDTIRFPQSE
jgi:DNA modification methylase